MKILGSKVSLFFKRVATFERRRSSSLATIILGTILAITTVPYVGYAQSSECSDDPLGTLVNTIFEKSGEPAVHLGHLLEYLRNNGADEGNQAANQIAKELNLVESTLPAIESALSQGNKSRTLDFSAKSSQGLVSLCNGFLSSFALGDNAGSNPSSGFNGADADDCRRNPRRCHKGCIGTGNNPQCGLIPNGSGKPGDLDECTSNVQCSKTILGCYYGQCKPVPDKKGVYRCANPSDCERWSCQNGKCQKIAGGNHPKHQCEMDDDCKPPKRLRFICEHNECKARTGFGLDDCGGCLFCPPDQEIVFPNTDTRPIPPASCRCKGGKELLPDGSCGCPPGKEWVPYPGNLHGRCLCKPELIQVGDKCEACEAPLVPHRSGASCVCPTGNMIKDSSGNISCGCPAGTGQVPVPEGCQCPAGSGMKDGKCTTCTGGTSPDPQSNECTHCEPPRKYSYSTKSCECPWGADWDGSGCTCKQGTAVQPDGTCKRCPYPQVAIYGKCEMCPSGQSPQDSGAGCECNVGTVPDGNGGCIACSSPGVVNGGQCQCPPGHTLNMGYCFKNPCEISGQTRDDKGECSCPSGEEVVGNKCLKKCNENEIRLQNGSCFQVEPCQPGTIVCYNPNDGSKCSSDDNSSNESPRCFCRVCKLALS